MMESKIAKHLRMDNQPVAVLWTDEMPASAVHFKEDRWGCVVALIKAASQGKIAAAANAIVERFRQAAGCNSRSAGFLACVYYQYFHCIGKGTKKK